MEGHLLKEKQHDQLIVSYLDQQQKQTTKKGSQQKLQTGLIVNVFGRTLYLNGQKLSKPLPKIRIPTFSVKIGITKKPLMDISAFKFGLKLSSNLLIIQE